MARGNVETPLFHDYLERLGHTVHEIPAWAGRHWKSLSLVVIASAGGGYMLITNGRGPDNPPIQPTASASDTFNRSDSGLDVTIPKENLSKQEIDPNTVQITFDQLSKATVATENGRILSIIPPPMSQDRELDRDQGFEIEVFWETLAGTPKPSRPLGFVITTAEGERIEGNVKNTSQASLKQEETSGQLDISPSVIDPKSLRIIFIDDIGSIIAVGPDGSLVRVVAVPPGYSRQVNHIVDASVWRRTTGGRIVGDPVGANVKAGDGANIERPIERVTQLRIAA